MSHHLDAVANVQNRYTCMTKVGSSATTGGTALSGIGVFCGLLMLFLGTSIAASDINGEELFCPVREVVERWIHWEDRVPMRVDRTLYDKAGHRLESYSWEETNGTVIPKSKRKALYQYDPSGRLITLITYFGEDGSMSGTMTYTYDQKGQKTGEILRDGKGRETNRWMYSWDDKGNKIEDAGWPDGQLFPEANAPRRVRWKYDSQNHAIEGTATKSDGAFEWKALYKHDDKGRISEMISLKSDGSVRDREVFQYDRSGRIVEKLELKAEGTLGFKATYMYKDDAKGNWVKKTPNRWSYYNKSGNPERLSTEVITRTITYY
jgi:YD repeat-containing protein